MNTALEPPVHAQRKQAFDLSQLQIVRNMYVPLPGKKIQVKAEELTMYIFLLKQLSITDFWIIPAFCCAKLSWQLLLSLQRAAMYTTRIFIYLFFYFMGMFAEQAFLAEIQICLANIQTLKHLALSCCSCCLIAMISNGFGPQVLTLNIPLGWIVVLQGWE